jgi:cobyrinic acid a,c-diamide synthase
VLGVPMLGGLVRDLQVDIAMDICANKQRFCPQLANCLGNALRSSWQERVYQSITHRDAWQECGADLFCHRRGGRPLVLAMAYDEAFFEYCPETLEMLEASGVCVETFSPLHDASLPAGTDLLFIGSGRFAPYAHRLTQNHCIRSAISDFVGSGGRVWAESDGLAYLCQQAVLSDGRRLPMTGVLPAVAYANAAAGELQPVEIPVQCDTWLAKAGSVVRGYRDNSWEVQSTAGSASLSEARSRNDLFGNRRVIGSRVALNLAIQPELLRNFAPCEAIGVC